MLAASILLLPLILPLLPSTLSLSCMHMLILKKQAVINSTATMKLILSTYSESMEADLSTVKSGKNQALADMLTGAL